MTVGPVDDALPVGQSFCEAGARGGEECGAILGHGYRISMASP
jgi:hypothetical protein